MVFSARRLTRTLLITLAGLSIATSLSCASRQVEGQASNAESAVPSAVSSAATEPETQTADTPTESGVHAAADDYFGGGTEVCVRCGAVHEVTLHRKGPRTYDAVASSEQAWAEARIGACKEHCWQPTGCWFRRYRHTSSVSCYMRPDEHLLWKALTKLDAVPAELMLHRFAELQQKRQIELWEDANRNDGYPELSDKQLARTIAEAAGWSDLAAYWAD